jgi:response regulator RpfG family c-di-GMP phosphodiesterase
MTAIGNPLLERRSVTLVEDEPSMLDVLTRAARGIRFDCQGARSAEEAVALLEKVPTPLVVTDLRMPGRGGVWLVREIQKRWPEIGVIVLTVGAEEDALRECLAAGVHHYFLKPIHLDEFHHALEAAWAGQRLQRRILRQKHRLLRTVQRQTRQLRRTFYSAVVSLVRTLEARDAYTNGHSRRVRALSLRLAVNVGLDAHHRKLLSLAARLHDIGKIGMAEGILNKPTALDPHEFSLVRQHPVLGERILRPIIRSREVLSAIRSHHERYDGLGYPDGLRGQDIPLLARIITVADCFDAMTSSRAYRGALATQAALDLMSEGRGSQFDPELVPPFVAMIREG